MIFQALVIGIPSFICTNNTISSEFLLPLLFPYAQRSYYHYCFPSSFSPRCHPKPSDTLTDCKDKGKVAVSSSCKEQRKWRRGNNLKGRQRAVTNGSTILKEVSMVTIGLQPWASDWYWICTVKTQKKCKYSGLCHIKQVNPVLLHLVELFFLSSTPSIFTTLRPFCSNIQLPLFSGLRKQDRREMGKKLIKKDGILKIDMWKKREQKNEGDRRHKKQKEYWS